MKNCLACLLLFVLATSSFSQIRVRSSTRQLFHSNTGESYANYSVAFNKKAAAMKIDSVKCTADNSAIMFAFRKNEKGRYFLSFTQPVSGLKKCKTCPEVILPYSDLSKGIIIYYHIGKENHSLKAVRFKQLRDVFTN